MTRSERLSPVLKLAETKKRVAAQTAARALAKLRRYEDKLKELKGYRSEYAGLENHDGQILTARQLHERQNFIRQLDQAIGILKHKVEGQKQASSVDQQLWMDAHRHSDAIDKLIGKIQKIEIELRENRIENELGDRPQQGKRRY